MLVSGIMVLATFCGFAAGAGETLVNFKKVSVVTDGKVLGKWTATITESKPVNEVSMKTPVLTDIIAAEKMMLRVKANMDGNALPPFEMTACEGLKDEMIGKKVVAAGKPFPDKCPLKKGNYQFEGLMMGGEKFPPIPDGKMDGVLELYMPGENPLATVNFEATVSHNMPGVG